ncbi:MAG: cytochrome c3 family protein [Thermodesulfovibrionales bacterium]|jgi:predicted CXXCH cytochrome family protein
MKRIIVLFLGLAVLAFGFSAYAGISSTMHNLTTGGFFPTKTTSAVFTNPSNVADAYSVDLCAFCHIPHGGSTAITGAPLWSRLTPATATYSVYGSGTAGGTTGSTLSQTVVGVPGPMSLTCLSCHDGTISIGTISKNGITLTASMTGNVNASGDISRPSATNSYNPDLTQDLRNDHPVGLTYQPTSPTSVAGLQSSISATGPPFYIKIGTVNTFPIFGGSGLNTSTFECASCHDPHTVVNTFFLRDNPSTICQDCHVNK